SLCQINRSSVDALQPVILEFHFIAELHGDRFAVGWEMGKQEPPVTVEHLQFRIAVWNNLTQKCVYLHVAGKLLTKFALLVVIRERPEPINCWLKMTLHVSVIG